ncbi:hypothetical protein [Candidatus Pyrohabitans sp.]
MRERVSDALLSPAELEKRCTDFKEEWYGVAREIDAIAEFSTGEQPGFRRALLRIGKSLENLLSELDVITLSAKKNLPEIRAEVDSYSGSIEQGFRKFSAKVEGELGKLERFTAIKRQVASLRNEIEKMGREFREVEARVATLCTKFFERQRELTLAKEKIKARVEKGLYDLQVEFEDRVEGIVGDYELHHAGEPTTPKQLFIAILKDPGTIEKVYLKETRPTRSFLGIKLRKEEMTAEARLEVLRYVAQELAEKARRIKESEMENVRKLNKEFADLDSLEKACRDVERRREELENYKEELEGKIAQLEEGINRNFDDYNEILSIKEEFASTFDSIEPEVRRFLEYIAGAFEGFEIERDPEKRRLLSKIAQLEEEVQRLSSLLEEVGKEKAMLEERVETYARELEDRRQAIRELKERNSELESKLSEIEREYDEFRSTGSEKLELLREENLRLKREVENLRSELEKYLKMSEEMEDKNKKLMKELEEGRNRASALEEEIARLKAEIRKSLTDILEKIKG